MSPLLARRRWDCGDVTYDVSYDSLINHLEHLSIDFWRRLFNKHHVV